MIIQDFRNGQTIQVKVNNRWYKLLSFTNDEFGIKKVVNKAFNPYFIFNKEETEKIIAYKTK